MLRKLICAVVIAGFAAGFASAQDVGGAQGKDQVQGKIVKVDVEGNKVTFQPYNPQTKQFGEAKEYQLPPDVKVHQMKGAQKEMVAEGLKAVIFRDVGPKGRTVILRMDQGRVAEIIVLQAELPNGGAKDKDR